MDPRLRTRNFLNALLLVMIVVLLWATAQAPYKKNTQDSKTAVFAWNQTDPPKLTVIRLQHPNREDITLHYTHNQWWLKTPLTVRANSARVKVLQRLTTVTSRSGFRTLGNDLSQYGLDPARLTLWLNDQRLDIGGREPLSGQRYVRRGDQVHLIDDHWSSALFAGVFEYVSPRLLPEDATPDLLQLPDARWDYSQGQWRRQSEHSRSDNIDGVEVAAAWSQAKALLVQSFNPALSWQGQLRIGIQGRPGTLRFEFAETATGLYLGRRDLGLQYLLPSSKTAVLLGHSSNRKRIKDSD